MNLIAVGINHKTAPIQIREKFFLSSTEQDLFLTELKCNPAVTEAFVLSTCNRIEIYANVLKTENHFTHFIQLLAQIKKLTFDPAMANHFYAYKGKEAVRHLLTVSTGLDSLVLGEKQILGQLKTSLERAQSKGMFHKSFNILSNLAIRTGKKAQTETDISFGGSSISWAAVVMAEKLLQSLEDKKILIMGMGKMGEMAIRQFRDKKAEKIYLMNRTPSTADTLAQKFSCLSAAFCDIKETLSEVDLAICSTDAPHYILDKETIEKIMALRVHRTPRPLILMDISMPRNIDPLVAELPNVHLTHIDDLENVVQETMRKRQKAIGLVEKIIEDKLQEFYSKFVGRPSEKPTKAASLNEEFPVSL